MNQNQNNHFDQEIFSLSHFSIEEVPLYLKCIGSFLNAEFEFPINPRVWPLYHT